MRMIRARAKLVEVLEVAVSVQVDNKVIFLKGMHCQGFLTNFSVRSLGQSRKIMRKIN